MDALAQQAASSMNKYVFHNYHSISAPTSQNHFNGHNLNHIYSQSPIHLSEPSDTADASPTASGVSSEPDLTKNPDYYEGVLRFLNQMLMEEDDLQNKPFMLHECLALQAAEKSFYDALVDRIPQALQSSLESFSLLENLDDITKWLMDFPSDNPHQALSSSSSNSQVSSLSEGDKGLSTCFSQGNYYANYGNMAQEVDNSSSNSTGKRNPSREGGDGSQEERSTKQLASCAKGSYESELMYDRVLLCKEMNPHLISGTQEASKSSKKKGSHSGKYRGRRMVDNRKEIVDLMSLLTQCGQTLANSDISSAHELLKKIRQHSSPHGDSTERLAYYFANAIEARLADTGTDLYRAFGTQRISAAEILKAYHAYMKASPFHKMSNLMANKTIKELVECKSKVHIIHFGILYGFQWPCFIQNLSLRAGGLPKLWITGIDFPQPGFRLAEHIEETGSRLENYCKRFNVPFELSTLSRYGSLCCSKKHCISFARGSGMQLPTSLHSLKCFEATAPHDENASSFLNKKFMGRM